MFSLFMKWLNIRRQIPASETPSRQQRNGLSTSLEANLEKIQTSLHQACDLKIRRFMIGEVSAALVFFSDLVNIRQIEMSILQPLRLSKQKQPRSKVTMQSLKNWELSSLQADLVHDFDQVIESLLNQHAVLFVDGEAEAMAFQAPPQLTRAITEPAAEMVVNGPREGFVENIWTNLGLVRKRLKNTQLHVESWETGATTHTKVFLLYLQDKVQPGILQIVRNRLSRLQNASVVEFNHVERVLEEHPFTVFPRMKATERPDSTVMHLLAGRAAILVDGNPVALIAPISFWNFFESIEDVNNRFVFSFIIRLTRFSAYFISLSLPALYIAIENFHKELIPTPLLLSFTHAREGVPFPLVIEVTGMIFLFELLREAGIRMPRAIGQAVSIVGALVIGESAVNAGIIGAPTVIVVSLMGVTAFIVNPLNESVTVLRLFILAVSSIFGLYGYLSSMLLVLYCLIGTKSFGEPYMTPIAPLQKKGLLVALSGYFPQLMKETEEAAKKEEESKG